MPTKASLEALVSDDIVTRLRAWHTEWDWYLPDDAADEIERLRHERFEWFLVACGLRDAVTGNLDVHAAFDDYLRVRGRLEDPRDALEGNKGE